ncbi:unnamed protein product [Rotaria socialis]|uniref:Uncharacterized protein n=1 Tax=Rotaria socialis TaxID=392032 RepID=A0A820T6W4_9BILA|nr:unnamed protein product [Rotaria socialis]CAF3344961.1 unnamed protein product [Rotaria socialis]CAF3690786.1 unnamed protein product [Rotaria socialis]CAF4461038.1 unnamed protein product [Rotaria socialis]CAF4494224.1 unnamed protein product [Rotaria socialis]
MWLVFLLVVVSVVGGTPVTIIDHLQALSDCVAKLEQRLLLCTGRVNHTQFQRHTGLRSGIYIHVNTSQCEFSSTPTYLTSLTGNSTRWATVGISTAYSPSVMGFDVHLAYWDLGSATEYMLMAAYQHQWALEWVGIAKTHS